MDNGWYWIDVEQNEAACRKHRVADVPEDIYKAWREKHRQDLRRLKTLCTVCAPAT